uniref:Uncharacterized protein n=1 Tax=Pan troglodytes TaxID=9598 RepID=A0A2I3SVK8_PANTR
SPPPQSLRLVAPVWNGRIRGIHRLGGAVAPEGNQKKKRTILQFLTNYFYDVEALRDYLLQREMYKVHEKNRSYTWLEKQHGPYGAGAFFILKQGGAVKFRDKEWIRPDKYGHFSQEFWNFCEVPVEAVDASDCDINYEGLDNLLRLKELHPCRCMDDWCLSRLYPLADSLRSAQAGPRCDYLGPPCRVQPGLTQILVEEMLPNCRGCGWSTGPREEQPQDTASPVPA